MEYVTISPSMYVIVLELMFVSARTTRGYLTLLGTRPRFFWLLFSSYPLRVGSGRDVNGCHAGETPQYLVSRNGERVRS